MQLKRLRLVFLFVVYSLIAAVNGCKCETQTPLESFCRADWVSHLRVKLRITKQPMLDNPLRKGLTNIKYLVHHIRIYKEPPEFSNGTLPVEIFTPSEAPACGLMLEAGNEYLLSGSVSEGTLTTLLCGQVLDDDATSRTFENVLKWSMVSEKFQQWLDEDKSAQCE
ncbi:Putative metalloproteinase inhibitor [Toxocara canis]|uniref:Putative metalloproteinase inhibitor n=2 Tax=Toxocara canis TaxID=6265 RepID=A0A0B2W4Z3_TOXCA|nr:Putative metalloproteinase inhibitor [Toxocara canis]VDM37427.1 unnamed protein product [Toxocara canis]